MAAIKTTIIDRDTLKSWFIRGAKPLASQFAAWIDSFVHVTDTVPATQVSGLADELNLKADVTALDAEIQTRSDAYVALQTALDGKVDKSVISQTALQVTDAGDLTLNGAVTGFNVNGNNTGNVWNLGSCPAGSWSKAAYGNGIFMAAGYDDGSIVSVITSSDFGVNWTKTAISADLFTPAAVSIGALVFINGLFWLCGPGIASTKDGVNWVVNKQYTGDSFNNIAYGNGIYCAIGIGTDPQGSSGSAVNVIWTSSDMYSWTRALIPYNNWMGLAFGNGKFVAVPYFTSAKVMYSSDALNWTVVTLGWGGLWSTLVFTGGLFVTCDQGASAMTSIDGATWTQHLNAFPSAAYRDTLVYGNGLLVTGDSINGGIVDISQDGTNWTEKTINVPNLQVVVYGAGTFIALPAGAGGSVIAISQDGAVITPIYNKTKINSKGVAFFCEYSLFALNTPPSSATDTGTAGEIRYCADAIYICIATNTWVKTTLATW